MRRTWTKRKRTGYIDAQGRKLKSKFEVKVSDALGKGWDYEQVKFPYVLENNYTPDFYRPTGEHVATFVEAKGRFTGTDRRKMLAVKAQHPHADIRLVFMRDCPLYKGAKSKYSDWCKKHNFPFSIFPRLPI